MTQITHLISTLEGGGAEKQAFTILKESKKRGIRVSLIALALSQESRDILEDLDITYHVVGKSLLKAQLRVFKIVFKERPDILSSWLTQMDVISGIVSIALGISWIINERSSAEAYSESINNKAINPILLRLRNLLGRYSNIVIANSLAGKNYWINQRSHENVVFIPNLFDQESIQLVPVHLSKQLKKPYIVTVGSLIESKNTISLINSMSIINQSKELYLYVIGDGPSKDSLQRRVTDLGLAEKVLFLGKIKRWHSLLVESEGLVHPSLYEGMPNVVLESIFVKSPVLLSNIEAHSSLLTEEQTLFFNPLDENDIANTILKMLNNKLQTQERAYLAYNSIKIFHPNKIFDSLINIYTKINQ